MTGSGANSWLLSGLTQSLRCLVLLALAMTASCGDVLGKSYPPYRYRLTVEIDTPQGVRRGSSVIEVRTSVAGSNSIPNPGSVSTRIKGEAVAIDLPNGQTVFALLRSDWDSEWAGDVYGLLIPRLSEQEVKSRSPDGKWSSQVEFDLAMERLLASRGPKVVPRTRDLMGRPVDNWPMFVRFRDIRDPATVEQVDPDNFGASFGKGYAVRRIVAERTEDAVGGRVGEHLDAQFFRTWAAKANDALKGGLFDNNNADQLIVRLNRNDFYGDYQ